MSLDMSAPEIALPNTRSLSELVVPRAMVREYRPERSVLPPQEMQLAMATDIFGRLLRQAAREFGFDAPATVAQVERVSPRARGALRTDKPDSYYDGTFVGPVRSIYGAQTPFGKMNYFLPRGREAQKVATSVEPIIFVNGMSAPLWRVRWDMQSLANKTSQRVLGIYNAHDGDGFDFLQATKEWLNIDHTNPAVHTTMRLIEDALQNKRDITIVAHSQGAIIVSRALELVKEKLELAGKSEADIEGQLGVLKIVTVGAAISSYIDGPEYIHFINERDPIAMFMGLGPHNLSERRLEVLRATTVRNDWWLRLGTDIMNDLGLDRINPMRPGAGAEFIRFRVRPESGIWQDTHMMPVYIERFPRAVMPDGR